jgi:hypothetical protein
MGSMPGRNDALGASELGLATWAKGSIDRMGSSKNFRCVAVWQPTVGTAGIMPPSICVPVGQLRVCSDQSGVLWGRSHGRVQCGCSYLRRSASGRRLSVRSWTSSRLLLASTAPSSPRRAAGGYCNRGDVCRDGRLDLGPATLSRQPIHDSGRFTRCCDVRCRSFSPSSSSASYPRHASRLKPRTSSICRRRRRSGRT